jgi:carboxypeptidase D
MLTTMFRVALTSLTATLLVDTVFAGRFSEFAHRKGFGPNLKPRTSTGPNSTDSGTNFRFLSNSTQSQYLPFLLPSNWYEITY